MSNYEDETPNYFENQAYWASSNRGAKDRGCHTLWSPLGQYEN